ncbi:MAG TPA: hypothetical protein VL309_08160 [Vicinamibacterales bacterium]|nr:hypothetical protein [Vicinamibacterales bacterium]
MPSTGAGGWREGLLALVVSALLAVALTWPLAPGLARIGRDDADGRFSIWNVAWVAHALTTDPRHVFDANIFYPHHGTLAYSENNLVAGAFGIPVWIATHNANATHNSVVLIAFALAAAAMYVLALRLIGDRRAAAVSAVCYAFCPYVFSHMAHIQLLMTAGLPLAMLAFHRLADRPGAVRGAVLGVAIAGQALACGYYGIFVVLMVGFATLVTASVRRLWTRPAFWGALGTGAVVAVVIIAPAYAPYAALQRAGFDRGLDGARFYSPNWSAYLASSSYAHAWMLGLIAPWKNEVAFPGFVPVIFGAAGISWALARRSAAGRPQALNLPASARETLGIYGGLAGLGFWASFGPTAGLYTVLYRLIPAFGLLRAPGRFALVVAFGLAVLAGIGVAALLARVRSANLVGCVVVAAAAAEFVVPLQLPQAPPVDPVYRVLATLPRGPVIEMPFYYPAVGLFQHTKYMVASTAHWMPLVNGYSDYIPPDFYDHVNLLAPFPSRDAFRILQPGHVRYAVFHMYGYNDENRRDVVARLAEFAPYLRPLYEHEGTRLYEIVGYPK